LKKEFHPHILNLLQCIALEEKEQLSRYGFAGQNNLKTLKADGLALHPLQITRKTFGYADYPEITFRLNYPTNTNSFRDSAAIECFCAGQEPVKGVLMQLDGKTGVFRLFAPDFPDWLEEDGVGIKLAPDTRTTAIMKLVLEQLPENKVNNALFEKIHGAKKDEIIPLVLDTHMQFSNNNLNNSQQKAVQAIVQNNGMLIVHGPPGTGKTTTLIEAIQQLVKQQQKILVSAPSNTAVDNIAIGLLQRGVKILRIGNTSKVHDLIYPHTPEGGMGSNKPQQKEIKALKIRAEEFRKMALKYKRSFGKAEREQRNLLFAEVKKIRSEMKNILQYNEEKLYAEAQVILGTPIGIYDAKLKHGVYETLIIDEAGQCIEPLVWCIMPLANNYVLAGDHLQLLPTVLSEAAMRKGLNKSILEACVTNSGNIHLLDTQYRMRESIAGFSSNYFYEGALQTAAHLKDTGVHITLYDTAGTGYEEEQGAQGTSLQNQGELDLVNKILEAHNLLPEETVFISPYAGQVALAKEQLPATLRSSTIDSFQGQESHNIIISLVRSNNDSVIGFLNDYRRMNVAITRAKEQLFVIGDSATIGANSFYEQFLLYVEKHGEYKSAWDLAY
jgi:ATP-dependent RNA/DNA helicase IGHMBP2